MIDGTQIRLKILHNIRPLDVPECLSITTTRLTLCKFQCCHR